MPVEIGHIKNSLPSRVHIGLYRYPFSNVNRLGRPADPDWPAVVRRWMSLDA
jgi:hypothetical protein